MHAKMQWSSFEDNDRLDSMKKVGFIIIFIFLIIIFIGKENNNMISEYSVESNNDYQKTKLKKRKPATLIEERKTVSNEVSVEKKASKVLKRSVSNSLRIKIRTASSLENYFSKNEVVQINGRDYWFSESLRSIPIGKYEDHFGAEFARKSGYIFYEGNDISMGQAAVLRSSDKRLVALTGRVILKGITESKAKSIAGKLKVNLDVSMRHLGVYAIDVAGNALQVSNKLGTKISSLEIVEGRIHEK